MDVERGDGRIRGIERDGILRFTSMFVFGEMFVVEQCGPIARGTGGDRYERGTVVVVGFGRCSGVGGGGDGGGGGSGGGCSGAAVSPLTPGRRRLAAAGGRRRRVVAAVRRRATAAPGTAAPATAGGRHRHRHRLLDTTAGVDRARRRHVHASRPRYWWTS